MKGDALYNLYTYNLYSTYFFLKQQQSNNFQMSQLSNEAQAQWIDFFRKGEESFKLGQFEEAVEFYNMCIQINPNLSGAYNNKGLALRKLNKYEEAIHCFDRAINLDHSDSNALK